MRRWAIPATTIAVMIPAGASLGDQEKVNHSTVSQVRKQTLDFCDTIVNNNAGVNWGIQAVSTRSLRIGTSASLIAFAGVIVAGSLALLPFAEKQAIANVDDVERSSVRCERQAWLHINRSCLSRRSLPWMTEHSDSAAARLEVAAPDAQLIPEALPAPLLFQDHGEQALLQSALQQSTGDQPAPAASMIEPPQAPTETAIIVEPAPDTAPTPSPAATKSANEVPTRPIAPKATKVSHRDRQRKPSAAEDLQQHSKLNNKPQNIPISSYSADGTPRTVVIRPTSIQDSYFYSSPR
jgi:hypothetical protein